MAVTANPASARILLDLGIEPVDVYAMENAEKTYMSALREGIVTIEAATNGKGDSRSAILRDEFRRLRDKKRKKVNVSKLFERKHVLPVNKIKPQALLPPSEEISPSDSKKDGIGSILREILHILKLQFELDKKESAEDTKRRERQKQEERENAIESLTGGVKSALNVGKKLVGKVISPLKTVWESIAKFLKFTLIGVLFNGALNWFGEKENQEKMGRVWRFLKFWWPSILAGYLAFFTPIGGLVTGVVRFLTWALPALAALAKSPLLIGAGLFGMGAALPKMFPGLVDQDVEKGGPGDYSFGGPEEQRQLTTDQAQKGGPGDYSWGGYEEKRIQGLSGGGLVQYLNKGGKVPGSGNTDTVPAMLTPGEFVMTKGAVQKYGVNTLGGMNAAADNIKTHQCTDCAGGNLFSSYNKGGAVSALYNNYNKGGVVSALYNNYNEGGPVSVIYNNYNKGGPVSASYNEGDRVRAMLTPGEFVMTKGAVQKYGVNIFAGMNAAAGGTNKPQYKEGRVYARTGGEVLPPSSTLTEFTPQLSPDIIEVEGEREGIKQWIPLEVKGNLPVRVPVKVNTESRSIVLPTIHKEKADQMGSIREGSTIPTFDVASRSSSRRVTLTAIGVNV